MSNWLAKLIFTSRSAGRVENEPGRGVVAGAQAASAVRNGAKDGSIFSKPFKGILNYCEKLAENKEALGRVSKYVKLASENVNPLIVASSGLNIALAEDKQSAFITETGTLTGMFLMEGMMNKHLDKLVDKLPVNKKLAPIVKGIAFVIGSVGASGVGKAAGSAVAKAVKDSNTKYSQEQIAKTQKPYTPINVAA